MKRHTKLLRRVAIMAVATMTLAGCEMAALDSSPTMPGDGTPDTGLIPDSKRPIPIKPKKGTGSKIERPKLIDELINEIMSPNSVMEYEPCDIEEPR